MRLLLIGLAACAALTGPAAAQYSSPYQSGYTTETSPLAFLPPVAMEWMLRESVRQAMKPTSIEALDSAIDAAVGDDLETLGKKTRMSRADMASAMRYEIFKEGLDLIKQDISERQEAEDTTSDTAMLAMQAAETRRKQLEVLVKQARRKLTRKAHAVITD